jgi:hypothetical protein
LSSNKKKCLNFFPARKSFADADVVCKGLNAAATQLIIENAAENAAVLSNFTYIASQKS